MTCEPRPVLEPPPEAGWLRQLTVEDLEIPENHTHMRRLFRLLDRVARTELSNALADADLTHSEGRAVIRLVFDTQARLVCGRFTYTRCSARVHEHELIGIRALPDGAIWVSEAKPALRGWLLDAANLSLRAWLVAAIGNELDDLLSSCFEYGEAVATLAHHLDPNIPRMLKRFDLADCEAEARRRGAELAALLFTEEGSSQRAVATSIAACWSGTLAELLATTHGVLQPPAER